MLNSQARENFQTTESDAVFEARVKLVKSIAITALGLFVGGVMGGVLGLFAYVNSRNPAPHDGMYAILQTAGIIVGLIMGYLAARNAQAQDDMVEASLRAGGTLLRRYKPKPGNAGQSNVGQRTIGSAADDFLKTLLSKSN